ncbi:hypothetical protein DRO32_02040 [Candidatus Bathyarchaeota archaeon]|nr:MAG: hypothetical protein DRO32_02040 [Candidatus Bathyarchaeota archaeon]
MARRFKPLFTSPHEPNVLIPVFTDGEAVGFWDLRTPSKGLLSHIPDFQVVVYADGKEPGTGRYRPDLLAERIREEVEVFEAWVRSIQMRGGYAEFRFLRPDPSNPRLFYCDYYPPDGGDPFTFKIMLPPKYPEQPPRTEGLNKISYAKFRIPSTGEPCLGRLGKENWRKNWQRWGIAHYLALVGHYEATKQGLSIKELERRTGRRRT